MRCTGSKTGANGGYKPVLLLCLYYTFFLTENCTTLVLLFLAVAIQYIEHGVDGVSVSIRPVRLLCLVKGILRFYVKKK
jgi:hypothetical protein